MITLRDPVSPTTEQRTTPEARPSPAPACAVARFLEPGTGAILVVTIAVVAATAAVGIVAALAAALGAGAVAALADLRTRRIPNRLVALVAIAASAGMVHATLHGERAAVVASAVGALGFAGPLLVVHLVAPIAIGFGDVKLAATLGAAVGLVDPRLAVLALCIATGITGVVGLVVRRQALPLGPGLVVGVVAAAALGTRVWS